MSRYEKFDAVRTAIREIAGAPGSRAVMAAFDDSLAGDIARFRLRRKLRRWYKPAELENIIWDWATPGWAESRPAEAEVEAAE